MKREHKGTNPQDKTNGERLGMDVDHEEPGRGFGLRAGQRWK